MKKNQDVCQCGGVLNHDELIKEERRARRRAERKVRALEDALRDAIR